PVAAVNVRTRTGGSWLLLGLMAAAAGCGKGKADPRAAGGAGGPPGMPAEAAVARTDTVRDEIAATGQIEALQSIWLRPEVEGRIVGTLFHVDRGQRLAGDVRRGPAQAVRQQV